MPALAITGTIGSGKSFALRTLTSLLGAESFSADEENRRLLDSDHDVKGLILSQLGAACYREDGMANRKHLFDLITGDRSARAKLEAILHPRLQALWKPKAENARKSVSGYFLAEIPLLYEKQLEAFFDKVILVGCSDSVRTERLRRFRSVTPAASSAWLNMQLSQQAKADQAHHLLWNDGSEDGFHRQLRHLATQLLQS